MKVKELLIESTSPVILTVKPNGDNTVVTFKATASNGAPAALIKDLVWKVWTKEQQAAQKIVAARTLAGASLEKKVRDAGVYFKSNGFSLEYGLPEAEAKAAAEKMIATAEKEAAKWQQQRAKEKELSKAAPKARITPARSEFNKKMEEKFGKEIIKRVTARKYMGDDMHSWAVFVDGQPRWTGLGKSEVDYYKQQTYELLKNKKI